MKEKTKTIIYLILYVGMLIAMGFGGFYSSIEGIGVLAMNFIFVLWFLYCVCKKKTQLTIIGILKILGLIFMWAYIAYFVIIHVLLATFLCFLNEIGISSYGCSIPGR